MLSNCKMFYLIKTAFSNVQINREEHQGIISWDLKISQAVLREIATLQR